MAKRRYSITGWHVATCGWLLLIGGLSGCVTVRAASPDEAAKLVCVPLPTDWQTQIENLYGSTLKDPDSALYKFTVPQKSAYQGGCAWITRAEVNAKNSYGGYVGYQTHFFVVSDRGPEEVNTMLTTFLNSNNN